MTRILYLLGMVLALCCCSSKENNASSSSTGNTKDDVKANLVYSYYDFRNDDPGCPYTGFSGKEDFGRWSDGDTASIDLMAAPMSEVTVKLEVGGVIVPDSIPLIFDVEVNGERVSHISTNGHASLYMNISKENIASDGSIRMKFFFENAAAPCKYYPESHDMRKLGFALTSITVYGYSLKK